MQRPRKITFDQSSSTREEAVCIVALKHLFNTNTNTNKFILRNKALYMQGTNVKQVVNMNIHYIKDK